MDNLSSHKGPRVSKLIEAAGASLLYLPPYSPDFNPIENAFAKLKALLRKAAERTVEGSGPPLAASSMCSRPVSAPTTSPPQAMMQPDGIPL
jgi:transposase